MRSVAHKSLPTQPCRRRVSTACRFMSSTSAGSQPSDDAGPAPQRHHKGGQQAKHYKPPKPGDGMRQLRRLRPREDLERAGDEKRPHRFGNQIGGIANREAASGHVDKPLWEAIRSELYEHLPSTSPQGISLVLNAMARLGMKDEGLFGMIGERLNADWLMNFNVQDLAVMVNAYGRLRLRNEGLFERVAAELRWKIPEGNPKELVSIALAYVRLGAFDDALFLHLAKEVLHRLDKPPSTDDPLLQFATRDFANLAHAFAKLPSVGRLDWVVARDELEGLMGNVDDSSVRLLLRVAVELEGRVDEMNDMDMSNAAYAYGRIKLWYVPLFEAMAGRVLGLADQLKPPQGATLVYAFGRLPAPHTRPDVVSKLTDSLLARHSHPMKIQTEQMSMILCGYAAAAASSSPEPLPPSPHLLLVLLSSFPPESFSLWTLITLLNAASFAIRALRDTGNPSGVDKEWVVYTEAVMVHCERAEASLSLLDCVEGFEAACRLKAMGVGEDHLWRLLVDRLRANVTKLPSWQTDAIEHAGRGIGMSEEDIEPLTSPSSHPPLSLINKTRRVAPVPRNEVEDLGKLPATINDAPAESPYPLPPIMAYSQRQHSLAKRKAATGEKGTPVGGRMRVGETAAADRLLQGVGAREAIEGWKGKRRKAETEGG
ncbi:unnamed protein product [Vitrella brassicaformis CCMP3155]|uniref:Uncharacterized protein n=3 Tax=Vitrella brassicaformis TaxID=1169539 RepID=A0A0G4G569_VITBC|nr:unnamed protein product [Vitrella brassicaformis CCMP3155]|eukprot:CEM23467.1 unnamed protein product [Vitrella brassicaformis CCMP3155]